MKDHDDEAAYLEKVGPLQPGGFWKEVAAGLYDQDLPSIQLEVPGGGTEEEYVYFRWHVYEEKPGQFFVVIDLFIPWDAVDLAFDHKWASLKPAVAWAKNAVRKLAEVTRTFVKHRGMTPALAEALDLAMTRGFHDSPFLRPRTKSRS